MSNYKKTTAAGTKRRRASQIIINNPFDGQASVIFVREDRIILADSSSETKPIDNMVVPIDQETLSKLYPSYDVETGEIVESKGNRYGGTIVQGIMDGLEDVFITEGILRDTPPPPEPEPTPEVEPEPEE